MLHDQLTNETNQTVARQLDLLGAWWRRTLAARDAAPAPTPAARIEDWDYPLQAGKRSV